VALFARRPTPRVERVANHKARAHQFLIVLYVRAKAERDREEPWRLRRANFSVLDCLYASYSVPEQQNVSGSR